MADPVKPALMFCEAHPSVETIGAELQKAMTRFIGQKNTSETRYVMRRAMMNVLHRIQDEGRIDATEEHLETIATTMLVEFLGAPDYDLRERLRQIPDQTIEVFTDAFRWMNNIGLCLLDLEKKFRMGQIRGWSIANNGSMGVSVSVFPLDIEIIRGTVTVEDK